MTAELSLFRLDRAKPASPAASEAAETSGAAATMIHGLRRP
jgi:hypothetical protein